MKISGMLLIGATARKKIRWNLKLLMNTAGRGQHAKI